MMFHRKVQGVGQAVNHYVPVHNNSKKLNRPKTKKLLTFTQYAIEEDIITYKNMVFDVSNETDIASSLKIHFEPYYRVVLVYNNWDDDKRAAARLVLAVRILDFKHSMQITKNAKNDGIAIVVTVMQNDAEMYLHKMRKFGLDGYTEIA